MKVETIEKGCPLCGGDLKGTDKLKYFCKACNILFERGMFGAPKPQIQAEPETKIAAQKPTGLKYVVSTHSNSYHLPGCRYIKQINPENYSYMESRKDAEKGGYHACICVRKHGT